MWEVKQIQLYINWEATSHFPNFCLPTDTEQYSKQQHSETWMKSQIKFPW